MAGIKQALVFLILFVSTARATEFYSSRPDVLTLKAEQVGAESGIASSHKVRRGYMVLLAQLMTFFPDSEYYFLARDIEYLYDTARVLFRNQPAMLKRFHVVPISTVLSKSSGLKEYLTSHGVTKAKLKGRPALFVDSCCAGTVPDNIKAVLHYTGVKVQGFLIQNTKYPESALFATIAATGSAIEKHPHYTLSGTGFVAKTGMPYDVSTSGLDKPTQSVAFMKSIRHDFDNASARKEFADILKQMRIVYAYLTKSMGMHTAQAANALLKLKKVHDLPADELLSDMVSTEREGYASVDSARVEALKEKVAGGIYDPAMKMPAVDTMKSESSLIVKDLYKYSKEDQIAMSKSSMGDLADDSMDDLAPDLEQDFSGGDLQSKYKKAVLFWMKALEPSWIEAEKSTGRHLIVASERAGTLPEALDLLFGMIPNDSYLETNEPPAIVKAVASSVTRAASHYQFTLSSSTPLQEILRHDLMRSHYLAKKLIRQILTEGNPKYFDRLARTIIQSAPHLVENPRVLRWMKSAIESMDSISPLLFQAIWNSKDLPKHEKYNGFIRFVLSQKKKFQDKVMSLAVSSKDQAFQAFHMEAKSEKMSVKELIELWKDHTEKKDCEEALLEEAA